MNCLAVFRLVYYIAVWLHQHQFKTTIFPKSFVLLSVCKLHRFLRRQKSLNRCSKSQVICNSLNTKLFKDQGFGAKTCGLLIFFLFFFLRDPPQVSLFCLIICGHYLFLKYLLLWQSWLKLTKAFISVIVNTSKPTGCTRSDHIPRKVSSKDKWWLPRTSTYTCVPVWSGQLPLLSLWEKYFPSFTQ